MYGQTYTLYWHSGDLNPWPTAACAACSYGIQFYDSQKRRVISDRYTESHTYIKTDIHIDRNTDIKTDRHISWTRTHCGPPDPSVGKMHYNAGPPRWKCICINFYCRSPVSRCFYSGPKRSAENRQTDIKPQKARGQPYGEVNIFTSIQGIWTHGLRPHALHVITVRENDQFRG